MIRIMKYGELPNEEIFARSMPTMNVADKVAEILKNVRERGDAALREYTERYDHATPENLIVTKVKWRKRSKRRIRLSSRCWKRQRKTFASSTPGR